MILLHKGAETVEPDVWQILANAGTVVTLIAGALSILGAFAYWITRPKPHVRAEVEGAIEVKNAGRSRLLRDPFIEFATLGADGNAISGSGADPWGGGIQAHSGRLLWLHFGEKQSQVTKFGYISAITFRTHESVLVALYWQAPVVPWVRHRTVIVWTSADRESGIAPTVLKGSAASKEMRKRRTSG